MKTLMLLLQSQRNIEDVKFDHKCISNKLCSSRVHKMRKLIINYSMSRISHKLQYTEFGSDTQTLFFLREWVCGAG